jgi:hypothetical protein
MMVLSFNSKTTDISSAAAPVFTRSRVHRRFIAGFVFLNL